MNNNENTLLVEKYRPATLDEYIGNEALVEKFKIYIEKQDIPHLLLHGTPGTGKCLDFSEEILIEIELTDAEVKKLSKYII
jgi:replication-associated recombination protein RarA